MMCLGQECDDKGYKTKKSSEDRAVELDFLFEILLGSTTVFDNQLTLMGYLKTVFGLFYITFIHKKPKGSIREVFCVVRDTAIPDSVNEKESFK
jgi:hypothetical protein